MKRLKLHELEFSDGKKYKTFNKSGTFLGTVKAWNNDLILIRDHDDSMLFNVFNLKTVAGFEFEPILSEENLAVENITEILENALDIEWGDSVQLLDKYIYIEFYSNEEEYKFRLPYPNGGKQDFIKSDISKQISWIYEQMIIKLFGRG